MNFFRIMPEVVHVIFVNATEFLLKVTPIKEACY